MRIFLFRWSFSQRFKGAFPYFIMVLISLCGKRRNRIWIPSDEEGERMGGSLREFCEENGRRELLRQWATDKNGGKTPDGVFCGSSAMTWWRCDKGHSFSMRAAFHTTCEQSCPYCTRCKVLMGDNDLATVAPDVAAE